VPVLPTSPALSLPGLRCRCRCRYWRCEAVRPRGSRDPPADEALGCAARGPWPVACEQPRWPALGSRIGGAAQLQAGGPPTFWLDGLNNC